MKTLLMLTDGSIFGNSMAVPLVAPLCSGFQCCVDHGLCVEVGRRLTGWEVGEGIGVLLDDGSSREHGPQLLAGVDRVGRCVHVLLERVDPQVHRSRDRRPKQATGEPVILDLEVQFPVVVETLAEAREPANHED